MGFVLIFGTYFLLNFLIEKLIRNKLQVERKKGLWYGRVNKIHMWSEIALILALVIFFYNNRPLLMYFPSLLLALVFTLRASMEWIFNKESKQFIFVIVDGGMLTILVTLVINMDLF